MVSEIIMPRLTHDMQTGKIVRWLRKEGDIIKRGMPLFEVETDKAISEVDSEASGILAGLGFEAGSEVPIGTLLGYILNEGESIPVSRKGTGVDTEVRSQKFEPIDASSRKDPSKSLEIIATPLARNIARENQVDLIEVKGTGPRGRIVEADIRKYINQRSEASQTPDTGSQPTFDRLSLTRVQHATSRRMSQSNQDIPQFVLEEDVNMEHAKRWRDQYQKPNGVYPSYTALLIRVVASVLENYPRINASFDEGWVKIYRDINIGVAIATKDGLHVPVVKKANQLKVKQIQLYLDQLRSQAEHGKFESQFLGGGTFTITNLGMFGIARFQALINPPEAAILAVGSIREIPWCLPSNELGIAPIMTMRLSLDHRVVDGAVAAPFLMEIKNCLENLALLI
jgi:pyruvate dehydrogenase E2 component (dihydrolipoamide acetyltransferase)